MKLITFYGRGGQGAVTAAELLAVAAFKDNKYSQAFPSFGVERRGAPVQAFCKIDDKFIKSREQIYDPDYIIVLDSTLFKSIDIKDNTVAIVNSEKDYKKKNIYSINATKMAIEILKVPIVNTAMLGAFCATGEISINSLFDAIKEKIPQKTDANVALAENAYKMLLDIYKIKKQQIN